MGDFPYLVALTLCEFDAQRALPLTGHSLGADSAEENDPGVAGRELELERLTRLWQRSGDGGLRRAASELSLQVVEIFLWR